MTRYRLIYKDGTRGSIAWDWAGVLAMLSDPYLRRVVLRVEHA